MAYIHCVSKEYALGIGCISCILAFTIVPRLQYYVWKEERKKEKQPTCDSY